MKNFICNFSIFKNMVEAYIYGTASSMQGLEKQLNKIRGKILEGEIVFVEYEEGKFLELENYEKYELFLSKYFKEFS